MSVAPPLTATRVRLGDELVFNPALARGCAFTALAAWGALHWMGMLEPARAGRGWAVVLVGLLALVVLLRVRRLEGRARTLCAIAAMVPLAALALLAGGVRDELLRPDNWGELASGISRGISDLPGVRVPYRGLDEWVRTDITLGASALVLLAAALAFWPRRDGLGRPVAALIVLIVLYVVPVVALDFTAEFLRGAVFTLLMVAFLRLEKLRMPDTGAALGLALIVVVVGLLAAPALNRDQPWFDYETWALETSASKSTTFTWDHTYGPLNWPRDGRELLRVKAQRPAYWKAENLDAFDGAHWTRGNVTFEGPELPGDPRVERLGTQRIRVSVRNLRTDQFITAGYAFNVDLPNVEASPTLDGLYVPARTLRRGDTYTATIYSPRPTEAQRRRAGTNYRSDLSTYRTILVAGPGRPALTHIRVTFPDFGHAGDVMEAGPPLLSERQIEGGLGRSSLARTWRLSQRLKRGAKTPEDYVERVLSYLGSDDFSYTELPPKASRTLDGFLFDGKSGYCQQYSGAMALLLRMGGIPARVATGFSTGATDTKTGEYVVRDFDAHSWVEAYFPGWGWVTFDPTPAASPARSQPGDATTIANGGATGAVPSFGRDAPSSRPDASIAAPDPAPWWRTPLVLALLLAAAGAAFLVVRRRRRGAPSPLRELETALRRAGRPLTPATTLRALELGFGRTPAAAAYVRALRESRYRETPARPTRAERRGLRSELGRGGGLSGRLRAWWALPPR